MINVKHAKAEKEVSTKTNLLKVEYNGVVRMYLEGAEFPMKTAPTPEALYALDLCKKTILEFIKIITLPQFLLVYPFFLSTKFVEKILNNLVNICFPSLEPYLNYQFLSKEIQMNLANPARGTGKFTEEFLLNYGISQPLSHKIAQITAHIVEYDAFYRFKLWDLMAETDIVKLLISPKKEINRLLQICYERETVLGPYIKLKLKVLMKLTNLIFLSPKVNKSFKKALNKTDLALFKMDEEDFYWCSLREDYLYFGQLYEERIAELKRRGYKLPNIQKING